MFKIIKLLLSLLFSGTLAFSPLSGIFAQNLPDVLASGQVSDVEQWESRREYIKSMLEEYIYGTRPDYLLEGAVGGEEFRDPFFAEGNVLTRFFTLYYGDGRCFSLRVTRPDATGKYPVIMRFESNSDFRFPFERQAVGGGKYIVVAVNSMEAFPDVGEVTQRHMHEAKAIMAWACCASLTVDFLEGESFADCSRILITGHSRTGKAALCAAAFDERFAVCVPNSSGAAGASGMRSFGDDGSQNIGIVSDEPTWVCERLADFKDCASLLPVDLHFARALVAPRVILTTESRDGAESAWAGIKSTYAMFAASDKVFALYGKCENNLISIRSGEHNQLESDFALMLAVADSVFYSQPLDRSALRGETYEPRPSELVIKIISRGS